MCVWAVGGRGGVWCEVVQLGESIYRLSYGDWSTATSWYRWVACCSVVELVQVGGLALLAW